MFYYTERDVRCKMMAEGKIIDVADKKTSHSQYICQNKVIRQKVRNFRNTFIPSPILFFNLNSLIIRSFKSRNWLNYHTLPCDRLNWHTLLNQWEDRKFTWSIIIQNVLRFSLQWHLQFLSFIIKSPSIHYVLSFTRIQ
jgi:hypothetical protein